MSADFPLPVVLAAGRRPWADPGRPENIAPEDWLAAGAALRRCPAIGRVLTVTDDPDLARVLARAGEAVLFRADLTREGAPLPPGALEGVLALLAQGAPADAPCLVLGAPPRSDAHALVAALRRAWRDDPERIAASIAPPVDHPCQLQQYCRVAGIGFAHFFDTDAAAAPWRDQGYCVSRKLPCPPVLAADDHADSDAGVRLVGDGDGMRVLFPVAQIAAWRAASGLPESAPPLGCSFWRSGAPARLLFFRLGEQCHAALCGPQEAPLIARLEFPGLTPGAFPRLAMLPGIATPCPPLPGDAAGIGYSLLQESYDGMYDIACDLPTADAPWERVGYDLVRKETGETIFGRQNYPECFLLDGRGLAGRLEALARFPEWLAQGGVRGITLDTPGETS